MLMKKGKMNRVNLNLKKMLIKGKQTIMATAFVIIGLYSLTFL